MKIGEISRKLNISRDTLRYYEKIGLIAPIGKKNTIREYDTKDIGRIEFIKCMRDAGLSIESLQQYFRYYDEGNSRDFERKNLLIEQREILMKKKKDIEISIKKLDEKIKNFESQIIVSEESFKKGK